MASTATASTAADIITGALLNLNSYAPGDALQPSDGTVGLQALNDLLDSLSNDRALIYTQQEYVFLWVSGQYEYTVGNPQVGTFLGVLTSGSNAITSVTALPAGLLATSGNQTGSTLTDYTGGGGGVIPYQTLVQPSPPWFAGTGYPTQAPTTVTQIAMPLTFTGTIAANATSATLASVNSGAAAWPYVTGANNVQFSDGEIRSVTFTQNSTAITWTGGLSNSVTAVGSAPNMILMSANATATPASNPDIVSYTVPGNIPIDRPLRFRSGFTRANASGGNANLDYTFTFTDLDNYKRELLKNVQGPWPYVAAYQPTMPYGTIYVYPNPSAGYTAHLFYDLILPNFANTTTAYALPRGYTRALKKLLALELAPIYMKPVTAELRESAKEARTLLQSTNNTPVPVLQYDSSIARSQVTDAGWILHGGFR